MAHGKLSSAEHTSGITGIEEQIHYITQRTAHIKPDTLGRAKDSRKEPAAFDNVIRWFHACRIERHGEGWGEEIFPHITVEKRSLGSVSSPSKRNRGERPDPWEVRSPSMQLDAQTRIAPNSTWQLLGHYTWPLDNICTRISIFDHAGVLYTCPSYISAPTSESWRLHLRSRSV